MKKIFASLILALSAAAPLSASAAWQILPNGVVVSNVCRSGMWYAFGPWNPVGMSCQFMTPAGIMMYGVVSQE